VNITDKLCGFVAVGGHGCLQWDYGRL